MKRIKFVLVVAAALVGMGGAFAGKKWKAVCEDHQQYILVSGQGFWPVSDDYYCYQVPNVCTYYLSNYAPEVYTICTYGDYVDPPQ